MSDTMTGSDSQSDGMNSETGDIDGDGLLEELGTDVNDIVDDVVTGAEDIVGDVLDGGDGANGNGNNNNNAARTR